MRIMNVHARYPGATHDSYIYNNSNLRQGLLAMQRELNTNAWLIGDSGYPLETCLLTPVPGNVEINSPEDRYSRSLCRARSIVEQCNGLLKARWRCLLKHRVLHYMPEKASSIINSCCVLHNMCLARYVPPPQEAEVLQGEEGDDHQNILQNRAQNMRPAGRMLLTGYKIKPERQRYSVDGPDWRVLDLRLERFGLPGKERKFFQPEESTRDW
ncbi:putative nuclease HARBI1 [Ischnura elegans]|uniref:putative nuclease HARBI1 n=1 Tax=Ischnura elegans TaxID=197161 RepID=UPI001ED8BF98|nr:putative nuclease HARBI1 [Ischnura elegans]